MFEELFDRKEADALLLEQYGFQKIQDHYIYTVPIYEHEFELEIIVDSSIHYRLIEQETNEEYIVYKTMSSGKFVSQIRSEIESVLKEISSSCFVSKVFVSRQAYKVISYVHKTYGIEFEHLWEKLPDHAIARRKDNKKWFVALLSCTGDKLELSTHEKVEIIDLRMNDEMRKELLNKDGYYPGWHMNKKYWYTIVLDSDIEDEELYSRIDFSYNLALNNKK